MQKAVVSQGRTMRDKMVGRRVTLRSSFEIIVYEVSSS
jgi:hypothetical protein